MAVSVVIAGPAAGKTQRAEVVAISGDGTRAPPRLTARNVVAQIIANGTDISGADALLARAGYVEVKRHTRRSRKRHIATFTRGGIAYVLRAVIEVVTTRIGDAAAR